MAEELLAKIEKVDSITARLILLDAYETTYGIYNHADEMANRDRPLALIAMHPKEDFSTHSALYNTIRRFRKYKVGHPDNFNMSLTEFLELPKDISDFLMDIMASEAAEEAARLQEQIKNMKKGQGVR